MLRHLAKLRVAQPAYSRLPFYCGSNSCFGCLNPSIAQGNKKYPARGYFLFLADGEGFEPPEDLRPQRFSRPPHSTALPPIRNYVSVGLSNLRFCSLSATGVAAHHSFTLNCALLVSLTRMQDRHIRPFCHPSETVVVFFRTTRTLYTKIYKTQSQNYRAIYRAFIPAISRFQITV